MPAKRVTGINEQGKWMIGGCLGFSLLLQLCFAGMSSVWAQDIDVQPDATQIQIARQRIERAKALNALESPGRVVVVYFTARDKAPARDHTARIRRITEETAQFYAQELKRHGFADCRMNVLRNARGQVEVIDVVGADKDQNYDKPDGSRIRAEVVPVLRQRGIDPEASVILLFCNLMDYDPVKSTIKHHSPYYGGGSYRSGTAWQCDSEILDPLRLTDRTPLLDGEYGKITIGRHNSIFIGGVIHELGHALSLPHCREREDEATRGTALMGSGNRTYGEQLRGEGKGTVLTLAHAFRLAAHPVFNRQVAESFNTSVKATYPALRLVTDDERRVRIQGSVQADVPVHAVIAYFDPEGGSDYDATTATAVPDDSGRFAFRSGALRAGKNYALRLVACHVNGDTSTRSYAFKVDASGSPDLSVARLDLELAPMLEALRKRDLAQAALELEARAKADPSLRPIGDVVLKRFTTAGKPLSVKPGAVPDDLPVLPLSQLVPDEATVGWIRPAYDQVPDSSSLLSLGGDYFASGIYAHAPAKHQYTINGKWQSLRGRCGIQGTNYGRVTFEIQGDGKQLWSSVNVTAGEGKSFDVDMRGVQVLTLLVTNSGDGDGGDWGVWIEPTLRR